MQLLPSVDILGVNIYLTTVDGVLDAIDKALVEDKKNIICHANLMALNLAYEQDWFRDFLNNADLVYCDGMGVRLGAWLLGYPQIPQRFTLADWIWSLTEFVAGREYSIFLLGNPPGIAQEAAAKLQHIYPNLNIAGSHHGFFTKNIDSPENQAVLDRIGDAHPDILLVGFGMPTQEKWIRENFTSIKARLILTCGAIFEYVTGDLRRGPRWMTDNYLEWLARVIISPQRYFKRYSSDIPKFVWRIIEQKYHAT